MMLDDMGCVVPGSGVGQGRSRWCHLPCGDRQLGFLGVVGCMEYPLVQGHRW